VRSAGAVPSAIAAMMRGDRKSRPAVYGPARRRSHTSDHGGETRLSFLECAATAFVKRSYTNMNATAQKKIVPNKVLVTGASGLLGVAAIEKFLSAGWDVVGVSRREPELPSGRDVRFLSVDLRDEEAARAAFEPLTDVTQIAYTALHETPRAGRWLVEQGTDRDQQRHAPQRGGTDRAHRLQFPAHQYPAGNEDLRRAPAPDPHPSPRT
jgi:NAD dependent epimerase/dehydratase family